MIPARRSMPAVAMCTCLVATLAQAQPVPIDAHVVVLADRYVVAGQALTTLATLERAVIPGMPVNVRLDQCGPAAGTAERAAAYRLRHLYLDMRLLDPDSASCRSAEATHTPAGPGAVALVPGNDATAADAWWRELMP